jgi:hypothetical protein
VAPAVAARATLAGLLEPLDAGCDVETLPGWLLPHQADAVRRAGAILRRFGGTLIADGVGLGKTFVALALVALERARGGAAAPGVPAALRREWASAGLQTGVSIPVVSHTQLARRPPALGSGVTLLIVDEAHAFRNPATRRYATLAELAVGRRVVLLTATPLNNSPSDLGALVHLFAGRDRFREFGVADLPAALRDEDGRGASLALAAISVCRSRRLVQARFPALRTSFPERRLAPAMEYDLNRVYAGRLEPLQLALARYAEASSAMERGAALLHLALLRRLESSRAALRRSLLRQRDFLAALRSAAAAGRRLSRREFHALFPRHDGDDSQLVFLPLLLAPRAPPSPADLAERERALDDALELVAAADARPDAKSDALEMLLSGQLAAERTIVFTEYRDTALQITRRLRRRFRVLTVTGGAAWAGPDRVSRRCALDAFSPRARGARADPLLEAQVLVATDVASEGMNLQDASVVVNYDLPWNPVRVMQRAGRVDRLGAAGRTVTLAHLVPAGGLRQLTGVLRTLRAKLAAAPRAIGAEPDPLAALWWLDLARPLAVSIDLESWRRVEPFEAAERWRMIAGPACERRPPRPLIAAGMLDADRDAGAGLLMALEWPDGARVPLPYVLNGDGTHRADGHALGQLAVRALGAGALPASPSDFACALASVLPNARAQLLSVSAARRGTAAADTGRRRAAAALLRAAHRAGEERDGPTIALLEEALAALRDGLTAGLDRRLERILRSGARDAALASAILAEIAPTLPPAGPPLEGTPRLVLVAAIALATRCPSA